MGGGLAVWMALSGAVAARGFIAVAPSIPFLSDLRQLLAASPPPEVRGQFFVGDQDPRALASAREVAGLMASHGLPCQVKVYPGLGHSFPPDFDRVLPGALELLISG